MIKLCTFLRRRTETSRGAFEHIWLTEHAPLAAIFPGLRHYRVSFVVGEELADVDALAELWFDSRASVQDAYSTEVGRRGSAHAEANTSRREHLYVASDTGTPVRGTGEFKIVVAAKRDAAIERQSFIEALRTAFAGSNAVRDASGGWLLEYAESDEVLNAGTEGALVPHRRENVHDIVATLRFTADRAMFDALGGSELADILARVKQLAARVEVLPLREHWVVEPAEPEEAKQLRQT